MARAMKDSGVEWIGEIPEGWAVLPSKRLFANMTETRRDGDIQLASTQKYGILGQQEYMELIGGRIVVAEKGLESWKHVEPNDYIISLRSFQGGLEWSGVAGCITWHYIVLRAIKQVHHGFYRWLFKSSTYITALQRTCNYIRDGQDLRFSNFVQVPLPYPPLQSQRCIAEYLETQTADIDASIAKTQESIEEYKKLKQAVITQSVTKGIRPGRVMKDSGVEWMGDIPEEWDVSRLKHHTYIRARLGWKGLKADEYVEQGYPMLSAFNIVNSKLKFENLNYINKERYDESPEIKLSLGDVLLVKDGAGIGKCAVVSELPMESTVNGSIALVTAGNSVSGFFLYYFFLSAPFVGFINYLKDGMGVPHLFQSDLREITFPLMDLQEQQEIAAYLDEKCAAIDTLIEKKQAIITELEAYKKSLIYEYVTGKKEVPVASC